MVTQVKYKKILEETMLPYAKKNMPRGWILQQDNDPKHTAKMIKTWMSSKKLRLLEWPSQSPDLNPIEHLWDALGRRVGRQKHSRKADLMAALHGIKVISIGITSSLETLNQREKQRGTSPEGHGRSLHESVHQGWNYDLKINTDDTTPEQTATIITHHLETDLP